MSSVHRGIAVLAVACLAAATVGVQGARAQWDPHPIGDVITSQHHLCGEEDLPEGDIQGHVPKADQDSRRAEHGYNCGLALVGHATLDLGGRPPTGNANMAWAGHCAYVAGPSGAIAPQSKPTPAPGAGVAVVSVASDGTPTHVANLRAPGTLSTSETINAVTTPEGRSILVVGQYGNDAVSEPKPMDIYDVSDPDCTRFVHLATYYWPNNIHNLTLSHDGRYVFATIPLQAADISGLWDDDPSTGVAYLGNLDQMMPGPTLAPGPLADYDDALPADVQALTHPLNTSHEAWLSADDRTLYVGAQTAETELLTILDVGDWLRQDGAGPRVISQRSGRGHSVRTATIDGVPYLLHSEESVFGTAYGCVPETANPFAGPAQPWLTDISDPTNPRLVSQFGLEINDAESCAQQLDAGENDSVHYHDVDDPEDTTFVMASMWNAGIRLFDVRDPTNPTEVAYFNPGDVDPTAATHLDHAWGHVRYVAETGQIWFATADGGFWVVRIEGQVRRQLALDAKDRRHGRPALRVPADDPGRPGTIGVTIAPLDVGLDVTPAYCTLGSLVRVTLPTP